MKKSLLCVVLLFALLLTGKEIVIGDYGAGSMVKPGKTFYVSVKGKDSNDGKTLKSAWRTLGRGVKDLRAGDTLLVAGGVYEEGSISLNVTNNQPEYRVQWGKKGSPIRVMGMPGAKVVVQGGKFFRVKDQSRVVTFKKVPAPVYKVVWEIPSQIELQSVDFPEIVREIPGTYYYDAKKRELTVHFVCKTPEGVRVAAERVAIRLRGSFLHFER